LRIFKLTKADKILKRTDFLQLTRCGKKINCRYFTAVFSPSQSDRTRLGVTITRKVGKAVKRNKIKRISREYFRLNRHNITGTWDINIIAKKEAGDLPPDLAFLSLKDIFDRISRTLDH
jgi:ribonuclease P protein component